MLAISTTKTTAAVSFVESERRIHQRFTIIRRKNESSIIIGIVRSVHTRVVGRRFCQGQSFRQVHAVESAKVGTTELQAGDYKAEWNGPADNLQVSIIQRGQTVATTQGHLKTLERPAPYSAVSESTLPDQTKRVDEIDFDHSKEALVVGGE